MGGHQVLHRAAAHNNIDQTALPDLPPYNKATLLLPYRYQGSFPKIATYDRGFSCNDCRDNVDDKRCLKMHKRNLTKNL